MRSGIHWDAISRAASWLPGQVHREDQDSSDGDNNSSRDLLPSTYQVP